MARIEMVRPFETLRSVSMDVPQVVAGSLLMALSAQLSVQLPFSPVPITAQTLTVLLIGALLGRRRGAASVLSYLAAGWAGMPVFAGGKAGPAALFGPTGGYLIGFAAAAFVTGLLFERGWDRHFGSTAAALAAGNLVVYLVGVPWLSLFVGHQTALSAGLTPFLVGDGLKLMMAAAALGIAPKLCAWMKE